MIRLAALIGILAISFSPIFVRLSGESPSTVALFRGLYALPILWILWRSIRQRDRRTARDRWIAFAGGTLLGADLAFWHRSIEWIGAGLATVLGNTQVIFVGLAAWLLFGDRPSRTAFAVLPVIFLGVTLTSGLGGLDAYGEAPVAGVIAGVLTGICYAAYLLTLRQASSTRSPTVGPLLDVTYGTAVSSLLIGLFDGGLSLTPSWPAHGWLVALALGSQVFGWLFITWALPQMPALEGSVLLLIQPVAAVSWGWLLLGETLSQLQLAGVALVLSGIALVSFFGGVTQKKTP